MQKLCYFRVHSIENDRTEYHTPRVVNSLSYIRFFGLVTGRLLHRWLSLVVVVYKVERYPLSLVAVFGSEGNNQRSLNDCLGLLSNLMLRLLKCPAEDSQFPLTCSTTVKCYYTLHIKYVNL